MLPRWFISETEVPKRETCTVKLRFARLYFLEVLAVIFRRNSDRLAYIPLRFHFGFRASSRKDFTRCRQKSISMLEQGVSFFSNKIYAIRMECSKKYYKRDLALCSVPSKLRFFRINFKLLAFFIMHLIMDFLKI